MRTSYHSQMAQRSCPRRYELSRVRDVSGVDGWTAEDKETNPDIGYGKAIGVGFAELLRSKDTDAAIFKASCAYPFWENDKKCFEGIVAAIKFLAKEFPLDLYTLVIDEAAIKIHLGADDWWVGFADAILRREDTGKFVVGEIKSCGHNREDLAPLYQNSEQALGYSLTLPMLLGNAGEAAFDVLYIVAHLPGKQWLPRIRTFNFNKTPNDRLGWLLNLQLDYEQYCRFRDISFWPMYGDSCLQWNRPCQFLGICQNIDPTEYPFRANDRVDAIEDWHIVTTLDELIDAEMERKQK